MEKMYTFLILNYYSFVSTFDLTIDTFSSWIIDPRATDHVTCDIGAFVEYKKVSTDSR